MEVNKAINKRRSIRSYKDIDIKNETIIDILNVGLLAPSAKNRQPWNFSVLKKKTKDIIGDMLIKKGEEIHDYKSAFYTGKTIKEAPVLIIVFKEKDDNWLTGDNLSIGACIENMCLKCIDLGLGSLCIRDIIYIKDEINKLLNENLELCCALAIGYPNETSSKRSRKKLEELTKWYE